MLVEFCLPIYNEEKILEKNTLKLLNFCQSQNYPFDWKIALVINGSSDKSADISRNLASQYPDKIISVVSPDPGRGKALKNYWLKSDANIAAYMDIDLATSLDNINDLVAPLSNNEADLAIGSRFLKNSKIDRSFIREMSSQGYNKFSRFIIGHNISDLQCGFKAVNIPLFKKIAPYIQNDKWFFDTELIIFADRFDFRIKEVAVDWEESRYDQRKSKVNVAKDSLIFISNLLKLKKRLKELNL